MTRKTFLILSLAISVGVGCDRCGGQPSNTPDSTAPAGSGHPMVVRTPDGGTRIETATISEEVAAKVAGPAPLKNMTGMGNAWAVECKSPGQPVSDTIFGIAFADADKDLGATAHRWGGNTTSRYNFKVGNLWSSAHDWFWENQQIDSVDTFLAKAEQKGGLAAITVPMLGWVAKDATSCSFPVSKFGPQDKTDDYRKDCGNGLKGDGKTEIKGADPNATSVKITPEDVGAWVAKLKAADAKRGKKVIFQYILDNETALWNSSHRDVHPEPTTYDELLEKTIAYATAIRKADPDAVIAGPAAWGWAEYNWSAKDHNNGYAKGPDRTAHGGQPLLAWYLQKLAEHEKKTGVRLLDVVDVHIYPQGDGVQGGPGGHGDGQTDRPTNEKRLRTTRSLWDRKYEDESWIKEPVFLIPRMKDLIAQNYPGRAFSIGEYNWGAEAHQSGGLALAESLGRFAQFGVSHAFYWDQPKPKSPAYWAFRAYRNYDGNGGHFLERIVPTSAPSGFSLFASRDEAGKKWVLIALNFSADRPESTSIDLRGCAAPGSIKSFVDTGAEAGFTAGDAKIEGSKINVKLAPYSITVIELQ